MIRRGPTADAGLDDSRANRQASEEVCAANY